MNPKLRLAFGCYFGIIIQNLAQLSKNVSFSEYVSSCVTTENELGFY
jgi:hypothetical protein